MKGIFVLVFLGLYFANGHRIDIDGTKNVNKYPSSGDCSKYQRYVVHNEEMVTFFEAWRRCHINGQRLATINNSADNDSIAQAINVTSDALRWWIGGTDLGNHGVWMWITTNKLVGGETGFVNFGPGQPDNYKNIEHCLELGGQGGTLWNDLPCTNKEYYICENLP